MLSPLTIFLLVAMFTLLALGWKKGYDFVQSRAPNSEILFRLRDLSNVDNTTRHWRVHIVHIAKPS